MSPLLVPKLATFVNEFTDKYNNKRKKKKKLNNDWKTKFFFPENTKHEKLDTWERAKKVQVDWIHHVVMWVRSVSYSHVPSEVDE